MASPGLSKGVGIIALIISLSLSLLHTPAETQKQPAARCATAAPEPQGHYAALQGSFRELLELSQTEQRGRSGIVRGQSIGAIVMQSHGEEAVEVRNQTHKRFIMRLDRLDAFGIH